MEAFMSRRSGAGYKPVKNWISVTPSGCGINYNYCTRTEMISLIVASWKEKSKWFGRFMAGVTGRPSLFTLQYALRSSVYVPVLLPSFRRNCYSTIQDRKTTNNAQPGISPLVGCLLPSIQYIRSYPPFLPAVASTTCDRRTRHATATRHYCKKLKKQA
jgi:hypothetical protein